ncbi:MAG: hypothetical protein SOY92_08505 [Prevotella sp.]|nr:hypothetical protein [Prevotella sp.]MDY4806058.1 hypothetical protein [Prevotella sp.]
MSRTPIKRQLFAKALSPILVMVEGRVNVPEKSLLQNALSAIILSPLGKWSSPFKLLSIKAEDPILERPSCSVRVPLKPHLSNAELGTDDTPWGISIEPVRFSQ